MLAGFHAMDEHFRTAPFEENLPVLLGLLGVWYDDFFGAETRRGAAVQPVPRRASRPTCSSSTWRATASGSTADGRRGRRCQTGPIVWGEPGTNGQHAFYQLIHQGTRLDPGRLHRRSSRPPSRVGEHHDLLMANFFAQTEALAFGKTAERGARPRARRRRWCRTAPFPGNRPTNTILRRAS